MSSYLRAIRLVNFRNYADATALLSPGLNIVVGDNAQGKTNLLEAISFTVTGSSPRTANDSEVVRWEADFARTEMRVALDGDGGEERKVAVGYAPGQKKRPTVDGAPATSLANYAAGGAGVRVVTFFPDDIRIVKGRRPTAGSSSTACSRRCAQPTPGPSASTARRWVSATNCCVASVTGSPRSVRSRHGTGRWWTSANNSFGDVRRPCRSSMSTSLPL